MKYRLFNLCALSAALLGSGAAVYAKDAASAASAPASSPARTAQQQKMKDCNAQAKADGKKGADRKAFMKECLSSKKS